MTRTNTCTSKDNTWLMPTPTQSIPYLQLSEFEFSAPKCKKVDLPPSSAPVPVHKSILYFKENGYAQHAIQVNIKQKSPKTFKFILSRHYINDY